MSFIVGIIVLLVTLTSSIWFKKINIFVFLLAIIAIVFFSYAPSYIEDYSNYLFAYEQLQFTVGRFEWGYTFLSKLFFNLGMSFIDFRVMLSALSILAIIISIRLFNANVPFVLCLYFLFPFLIDIVQIRNFTMLAFVLLGGSCLISSKRSKYLLCLFFILIGASFHTIGYFYLVIIPLHILITRNKSKFIHIMLAFVVMLSVLLLIPFVRQGFANVTSLFASSYAVQYLEQGINTHFIFIWLIEFCALAVLYPVIQDNQKKVVEIVYAFVLATCLALPLYVLNGSAFRIVRNIFPLLYIVMPLGVKAVKSLLGKYLYILLCIFMVCVAMLLQYTHLFDSSLVPILFENTWQISN